MKPKTDLENFKIHLWSPIFPIAWKQRKQKAAPMLTQQNDSTKFQLDKVMARKFNTSNLQTRSYTLDRKKQQRNQPVDSIESDTVSN